MRLRATAVAAVPVGAPALAAVRPSAVRVLAGAGSTRVTDADRPERVTDADRPDRIPAIVTGLEPQADLVRVRTDRLDALVPPADVADLRLRIGDRVTLDVPPSAVTVYPA